MSDQQENYGGCFTQKVIWITGASSGIGEALTKIFARCGARLVLSARTEAELQRVRSECIAAGASAEDILVIPLDIVDYDAMPGAVASVLKAFTRIDMLINNAGMSQRSFCLDTNMDVYRRMLEINVIGQIALTKQVLPVMVEQGSGRLVVTASVAGKVGAPLRTGYCAAKHAVMGFFDALRTEVAYLGIRVSTVVPGFIRTNISTNALTGTGEKFTQEDANIADGMDVDEAAQVIVRGLADGVEEIAVGAGEEMALLDLKRSDPVQAFRVLEGMAEQVRNEL
jgi:short-subunit dehydrogenase